MCGIIGILGKAAVANDLVDGLRRLEYRGYDSAGVATLEDGVVTRVRAEGKLRNLAERLSHHHLHGKTGIGHTRWATHGRPTENNAHPHATERVAVVHNGIIENFRELRDELAADGMTFSSQTDTEVVALLVDRALRNGLAPIEAVRETLPRLRGAFALAFLFAGEDDLLIGARAGAPLAVGYGQGENYLGSDALALAPFTDRISYLEDGDWAVLSRGAVMFFDSANREVVRPITVVPQGALLADKGNYSHFMAKEIHEQPEVVGRTIAHYVDLANGVVALPDTVNIDFAAIDRLVVVGCGTAFYAGAIAKYWFEQLAGLPVEIDVASEFRYREPPLSGRGLALFISQSGETADTLASLRYTQQGGWPSLAVVNVQTSTIARESTMMAPTLAGPEIGVASTKAFTCQLAVLLALAIHAGRVRGVLSAEREQELVGALVGVPALMNRVLAHETDVEVVARDLTHTTDVLYLGRGLSYPLALEGALKLKELSYIHAEGYAAGELKHGPIALIDETIPVIVIAPRDGVFEKTVSNIQEVAARGGNIILIGDRSAASEVGIAGETAIEMPPVHPVVVPLIYAIPVQLLAYHTARVMGKDVDQPRNLAKSVTVE
ncbi:glutamine--fructose-6-phosphate transaminase (isomerizing) [Pseudochelatococcus contaminans]|uniref:Glutamine--fructose-6-phosphate aminotransferase [isomerizing] n=1 Tax=Pseudochelatococcus contaminans TaxID=1538103 RepID=A0A7W5Z4W2_9HYPH|nr:glutamine--fructose-6-phosphate transaminase (isomerizing) [Pseudochelatococcus contaminans]MBB3810118.1 glucosamine--fructose-6-phosphate aminotransferase (isomerizing) [Pseudochelatococcus contaminans]